jgi:ATP adenylyltransferase
MDAEAAGHKSSRLRTSRSATESLGGGAKVTDDQCSFCCALSQGEPSGPNQILFEMEGFVAIPSVGAIVPGWLLAVPRRHSLCAGALTGGERSTLAAFVGNLLEQVRREFGPAVAFEHGPARPNLAVGCSVDHTHVHVVPTTVDVVKQCATVWSNQSITWREIGGLADLVLLHARGDSYIYVRDQNDTEFAATGPDIPSQLLRRVIARSIGDPESYDWRTSPQLDNVSKTVDRLGMLHRSRA